MRYHNVHRLPPESFVPSFHSTGKSGCPDGVFALMGVVLGLCRLPRTPLPRTPVNKGEGGRARSRTLPPKSRDSVTVVERTWGSPPSRPLRPTSSEAGSYSSGRRSCPPQSFRLQFTPDRPQPLMRSPFIVLPCIEMPLTSGGNFPSCTYIPYRW
jgi:hypothetical protein